MNNNQRNANISVQPSSFNGGANAQSFNFQSMYIINGYFYIVPPGYTNSGSKQNANQSVVLNELTNSPVILPVGKCVFAIVVGLKSQKFLTSAVGQNISCTIQYSKPAYYNSETNTWEPPDGLGTNSPLITSNLSQIVSGHSSTIVSSAIPAYNTLVAFMGSNYQTIEPSDTVVSVKILILNPSLAQ